MMSSSSCSKSEQVVENTSDTMSLHYTNSPASTSRPQFGHPPPPPDEPMDLADTLSYADNHPNWTQVWDPRMSTSFTTTKGLLNGPGENNCFLNSAVQVGLFGPFLLSLWSFLVVSFGNLLWSFLGPKPCVIRWLSRGIISALAPRIPIPFPVVFHIYLSSLS